MKVYFSHGKESGPWGRKITQLAEIAKKHGYQVESIDYTQFENPDSRVTLLANNIKSDDENVILVGSSMGGYVSLAVAENFRVKGMFLLAPALFIPGYEMEEFQPKCEHIEIVHGWSDEVIPPENSIKFARDHNSRLHLIEGDHGLTGSLGVIETLFSNFISYISDTNWAVG